MAHTFTINKIYDRISVKQVTYGRPKVETKVAENSTFVSTYFRGGIARSKTLRNIDI